LVTYFDQINPTTVYEIQDRYIFFIVLRPRY